MTRRSTHLNNLSKPPAALPVSPGGVVLLKRLRRSDVEPFQFASLKKHFVRRKATTRVNKEGKRVREVTFRALTAAESAVRLNVTMAYAVKELSNYGFERIVGRVVEYVMAASPESVDNL